MNITKYLLMIVVLQSLMVITLWKGDAFATTAQAAVPDPGADRKEMVSELKAVNEKLSGMLKLMESGKLQVEVVGADDKKSK